MSYNSLLQWCIHSSHVRADCRINSSLTKKTVWPSLFILNMFFVNTTAICTAIRCFHNYLPSNYNDVAN